MDWFVWVLFSHSRNFKKKFSKGSLKHIDQEEYWERAIRGDLKDQRIWRLN